MNIIVKGTKTIEEHDRLLQRAERYSRRHISSCERWQDGLPVECWRGSHGVVFIAYESGKYWQYQETEHGLEWW